MRFVPTAISGVWLVEIEPQVDERGFFARLWCQTELASAGLDARLDQVSVSLNTRAGTIRGVHWQAAPHAEAKLVRVSRGAIWDVAVDLRPGSPTHRRWVAHELTATGTRMLYVPAGCGHAFQTLADDTEVSYHISAPYVPAASRGARWDDPALAIAWPLPPTVIGGRDRAWPLLDEPVE